MLDHLKIEPQIAPDPRDDDMIKSGPAKGVAKSHITWRGGSQVIWTANPVLLPVGGCRCSVGSGPG